MTELPWLPPRFVVFDLETTGLNAQRHEIIEIGAIKANRDSDVHETFRALVTPVKKVPAVITGITGITQDMVDADGEPLELVLPEFVKFMEDLPLVAYNAQFDMAFLKKAAAQCRLHIGNRASCALKLARRAWPGRDSYKLSALAADGGMTVSGAHRALKDCQLTLIIYSAAKKRVRGACI